MFLCHCWPPLEVQRYRGERVLLVFDVVNQVLFWCSCLFVFDFWITVMRASEFHMCPEGGCRLDWLLSHPWFPVCLAVPFFDRMIPVLSDSDYHCVAAVLLRYHIQLKRSQSCVGAISFEPARLPSIKESK